MSTATYFRTALNAAHFPTAYASTTCQGCKRGIPVEKGVVVLRLYREKGYISQAIASAVPMKSTNDHVA